MFSEKNTFLISGIIAGVYAVYAGLRYYTLSGEGLLQPREAKDKIAQGVITRIIDVRTKTEYNAGHYDSKGKNVKLEHIPVTSFSKNKFKKMNKDTGVLVYCNTGQRARRAAELLRTYGFTNVFYIEGSYSSIE